MHYKTQLRHGVRDALDTVEAFSGRVVAGRVWPHLEEDGLSVNVETGKELSENAEDAVEHPSLQERKLELAVTIFDTVDVDVFDRLDAYQVLAEQVMGDPALFGVKLLGFQFVAAAPAKTTAVDAEGQDGAILAGVTLHFIATVSIAEGDPTVSLYGVF